MQKAFFAPIEDVLQNPYIGFVSFNHFRGEPLFSDTGTALGWVKERYPVYDFVEQEGDRQGWHPDTEMAYIRFLWKDFEPEDGKFNSDFVLDILKKAREHRQHLVLRMVPHNTRPYEDVPDWLKQRIPCPERPEAGRVKDFPAHPLFLERFTRAVRQLAALTDGDPVLYAVDIALTGAWGEGHGWDTYPKELLEALTDAYAEGFRHTHILGQICAPALNLRIREKRPIGWRGDGFAHDYHMQEYYPDHIHAMKDFWKDAPVSCEAYWYMKEWQNQGWDIRYPVDQAIRWHISFFNNKSSAIPHEWKEEVNRMLRGMGYRFALRRFYFPDNARPGEKLTGNLWMDNRGNAPIYNRLPLRLRLKNDTDEYIMSTDVDITRWLPGDTVEDFSVTLPESINPGQYQVQLCIGEAYPETPIVRLACDAEPDGDWYRMTRITVI